MIAELARGEMNRTSAAIVEPSDWTKNKTDHATRADAGVVGCAGASLMDGEDDGEQEDVAAGARSRRSTADAAAAALDAAAVSLPTR